MKSITILFLSFLVFATFTNSVRCTVDAPENLEQVFDTRNLEQVLDTRGNPIRFNTNYYIIPVKKGTGGGLTLRRTTRKPCPLGIFQEEWDQNLGNPVSFHLVNPKKCNTIRVSTYLNIDFPDNHVQCGRSNIWKVVDNYDKYTRRSYITVGGVKSHDWFKIEKYGRGYKVMSCPSVAPPHKVVCKYVGLVQYNGQKRLALSDVPYAVRFKKA